MDALRAAERRVPAISVSVSRAGFTLIELLLVLVIVALAVSGTALKLDGITAHSRLASTARKLGNTARFLRNQSIVLNREHFMDFDLREHRWRLVVIPDDVPFGVNVNDYAQRLPWSDLPSG